MIWVLTIMTVFGGQLTGSLQVEFATYEKCISAAVANTYATKGHPEIFVNGCEEKIKVNAVK